MVAFIRESLIIKLIFVQLFSKILCFNVKFHSFYDAEVEPFNTQVYKREMTQFFDKASYSFNGFKKVESVPVIFPIDICILKLENTKYATSLYGHPSGERHFVVFKMNNGSYKIIDDIRTPNAIAMDCIGVGSKGYIVIAFNYSIPVENARDGSPVYQLEDDRLRAIQYFSAANLYNVYLRVQGNNILLLQSFRNTKSLPNLYCPYFSWSGSTFNRIGRIPCSNARHLEPFSIDHENYVAVANYADQRGHTSTYSEIYKFIKDKKKFQLFQKIKTIGAVDVRFFRVPIDEFTQRNFLIFGNSLGKSENNVNDEDDENDGKNLEADSVFYIYEKGQFVPYQSLTVYALEQFLPIQNVDAEKFLLLVSSKNQDIKIYNLNDWRFEESKAQFTEGALGKGVARMRIFQEQEDSYLIIANQLMSANETNIFLPIFKQEEHANALRQEIIDWSKTNMERLSRINIDRLKNEVEEKLLLQQKKQVISTPKFYQIPTANIETVITQSLIHPQLHISSSYWKALEYANRALNALETQHTSTHQRQKREQQDDYEETLYDFEHIEVGTLHVKNKLSAKFINGIEFNKPSFESINAKNIIVTEQYIAPEKNVDNLVNSEESTSVFNIQQLKMQGKLNGYNWNELLNNTLKLKGTQSIKCNADFGKLKAESLTVQDNKISGIILDKIVLVNNGNFVVSQDVLFNAPVIAKNVIIKNRLNEIPINQGKFKVLLKRSNKTQIVTGQKRLNNLRVLQPITVAGSLSSNHLRAISPNKAIHDNLMLQGDYIINGDVMITKLLNTEDLVDLNKNISVESILNNAFHIDTRLEDVNMVFSSDIKANNSIVSFANAKHMQQLIKSNTDIPQIVSGLKIFKNGLNIENGFSEVKILNGFNVENLENQLLLKNMNQTILAPMHLERILVRGLQSPNLTINNNNITNYLTKSGNQHINGNLNVKILEVETFQVEDLNINGKIFDQALVDIYQVKSNVLPQNDIFRKEQKFLGTIHVKNLKINASLNEKTITEIENLLNQLNGNIKYVGNFKVNYNMNIENLTFNGQFNGINAKDFGSCWLRKTGEQSFTAIQTFDSVVFENGAILIGKLNGYFLGDFIDNTYWVDRNEFIKDAIFLNPVELQKPFETNTLNKFLVPGDMLYKSSEQAQIFQASITILSDLKIQGSILNASSLNNIHIGKLKRFLRDLEINNTLFLEHANFTYVPIYQTLNKYDLHKTLDKIWLTNENIDLANDVEISEGYFEGLLDFEGPVNNINLKYLRQNYLSKSRHQVISAEVVFTKNLNFESNIRADELNLIGPIIESESLRTLNLNEFVTNSLKRIGQHEIYGNWTIEEALIAGDIQNVAVNNLNLATEIVRFNANNVLTAEKGMTRASIEKIYTKDGSTINNVDVSNWMRYTVYVDKNQTIYGLTTLDNANLGDVKISGFVNDLVFDEQHILLTDLPQTIHGRYTFRNKFLKEQRILSNNIKNLYTERINGLEVSTFIRNLTKLAASDSNALSTHLIFEQPLLVTKYTSDNEKYGLKWKRNILDNEIIENDQNIYDLEKITRDLSTAVKETEGVLYDFELSQILYENATKLIPLTIRMANEIMYVVGITNESNLQDAVKFYYWNDDIKLFVPNYTNLSWLPQDPSRLEMMTLIFGAEYLTLQRPQGGEIYKENIIHDNNFEEMLGFTFNGESIESIKLAGKDCFALYGYNRSKSILIYCLNLSEENILLNLNKEYEIKKDAQQILRLSSSQIAILTEHTIEIWNSSLELKPHQLLTTINKAKIMAKGQIDDTTYLAVVTESNMKNLLSATVEIYSGQGGDFQYRQTLDLDVEPQQIVFSFLKVSHDLLLFVRTIDLDKPLLIYQLKGVMEFQLLGGPKTLLESTIHMQTLDLKAANKNLIVLFGAAGTVSFVDFKLRIF